MEMKSSKLYLINDMDSSEALGGKSTEIKAREVLAVKPPRRQRCATEEPRTKNSRECVERMRSVASEGMKMLAPNAPQCTLRTFEGSEFPCLSIITVTHLAYYSGDC